MIGVKRRNDHTLLIAGKHIPYIYGAFNMNKSPRIMTVYVKLYIIQILTADPSGGVYTARHRDVSSWRVCNIDNNACYVNQP